MRVDHRSKTVHFGTELAEAQSVDEAEGPHLQDMPSEQVCQETIVESIYEMKCIMWLLILIFDFYHSDSYPTHVNVGGARQESQNDPSRQNEDRE